jgi:NADH-quinone oxidoreductase subunit L
METAIALIPVLPFVGFLVNGLIGKRLGKEFAALVACAGPLASFGCSVAALLHLLQPGAQPLTVNIFTWIRADDLEVPFRLVVDHLSVMYCLVVTGVGSLIHIYSTEYMEHENKGGYARYFAYLNLFMSFMLILVTASNLPLLFVGWEGVGLASYLLIGFWYTVEDYANAGKKAFIVNRIGDFAFLLGIFTLFNAIPSRTLELSDLNRIAQHVKPGDLTLAAVFLFIGACGKSAQIPLYVWLPDAMAGPTPVSALIHAATMVTAGVYMTIRLHGLFEAAPVALYLITATGCATAFFAATMALPENDLKKVLAYSTVSQLGYMFVGVGTGAFAAGYFHVFTHAFFKALLFLGAGVIMHALAGNVDLRKMGGLRAKLPITFWLMLIGSLALAGIPPFAGFFSKDEILWTAFSHFLEHHQPFWLVIWIFGVITAGMTAFYTFRAFSLAFLGEPRGPADVHMHAHEPGKRMLVPLYILAIGAIGAGFLNVPALFSGHETLSHFLSPAVGMHEAEPQSAAIQWMAAAIPTALGILGVIAGTLLYARRPQPFAQFVERPAVRPFYSAMRNKYWVDQFYERNVVQQIKAGASALWEYVDVAIIDNAVHAVAGLATFVARQMRRIQAGVVNQYAFYVAGGALLLMVFALGIL